MRLAAIYNVWIDSVELLKGSIMCIKDHVDYVIIVYQIRSNFGEFGDPYPDIIDAVSIFPDENIIICEYEPAEPFIGSIHEINKRNIGLDLAKNLDMTHFLHMDCDEYYLNFGAAKQQFIDSGAKGSVCKIWTYFNKPTLRFENLDNYHVPFIHELRPSTFASMLSYPYYVDPTRRISGFKMHEANIVEIDEKMHHFSWVRKDINRKARNSSAKANIDKSMLLQDYNRPDLGPGVFIKDFNQTLVEVDNIFGINI